MAETTEFTRLCRLDELTEHSGRKFIVDDTEIAVFLVDGKVYALNNVCPHQHSSIIYDGFIEGGCVVCPAHGWMFDLSTGNMKTGRKGLDSYPVRIENGEIFVRVHKKVFNW
jgi:NAD(P)H-dependent nitrite reductase small subunit